MNKLGAAIMILLCSLIIKQRAFGAEEQVLASKPSVVSVKDALKAYKAGQKVYNCKLVELTENKAGTGLSFKNVKGSKNILTVSPNFLSIDQAIDKSEVVRCKEAEVTLTASGLRFKNK